MACERRLRSLGASPIQATSFLTFEAALLNRRNLPSRLPRIWLVVIQSTSCGLEGCAASASAINVTLS